jgi:hypothetical protein
VVEGAPLLRAYRLIPYRGFESLPLRHKCEGPHSGPFAFVAERDVWTNPPVRQIGRKADLDMHAQRACPEGASAMDGASQSLPLRHKCEGPQALARAAKPMPWPRGVRSATWPLEHRLRGVVPIGRLSSDSSFSADRKAKHER